MKIYIVNSFVYRVFNSIRQLISWYRRGLRPPSPMFVKHKILINNSVSNSTWIETGTYLGQTTNLLRKNCSKVYTFEPEINLFHNAKNYLGRHNNVEVLNYTSEIGLKKILPKITGNVNFWLDAHAVSNNKTKTYHGSTANPILYELEAIEDSITNFNKVCIFMDDVDLLRPHENPDAPSLDYVINWCKKNNLYWSIEHNILVAKN